MIFAVLDGNFIIISTAVFPSIRLLSDFSIYTLKKCALSKITVCKTVKDY